MVYFCHHKCLNLWGVKTRHCIYNTCSNLVLKTTFKKYEFYEFICAILLQLNVWIKYFINTISVETTCFVIHSSLNLMVSNRLWLVFSWVCKLKCLSTSAWIYLENTCLGHLLIVLSILHWTLVWGFEKKGFGNKTAGSKSSHHLDVFTKACVSTIGLDSICVKWCLSN